MISKALKECKKTPSFYTKKSFIVRITSAILLAMGILYLVPSIISKPHIEFNFTNILKSTLIFVLLSESVIGIDLLLEKLIPISVNNIRKRSTIQFILSLIVGAIIFLLFYYLHSDDKIAKAGSDVFLYAAVVMCLLIYIIHVSIMERITKQFISATEMVESLKLEKMTMSYKALQDQLNPHFLFNNLSVLKSMVFMKNDKAALKFIQNFSGVYRYVLKGRDLMTIKLSEEIEFIKQYISLHQERLQEGLKVIFDLDEKELSKHLPPMTLQLLVENALKHNIAEKERVLNIKISAKANRLCVENNVQSKDASYSTRMGLENLLNRYEFLTDEKVRLEDINGNFKVTVPLLCEE
ncbi:MAG: histidine kinase [Chloroflexia bacterium]|nr:histidine kinase [Chloroflexia bacterium]